MLLSAGEISAGLCLKPCCIASLVQDRFAKEDRNWGVLVAFADSGGIASETVEKSGALVNLAASRLINSDLNVFRVLMAG